MVEETPARIRIKRYLEARERSATDLSKAAGLNDQYVSQYLRGKSQSGKTDNLGKVATAMGLTLGELIAPLDQIPAPAAPSIKPEPPEPSTSVGRAVQVAEYDVRPQAGGGAPMPLLDGNGQHRVVSTWSIPADYLRAYTAEPEAIRIVRVAGDSMEPEYPAGERVAVDTSHRVPSPPGVYVLWDGFGLVLKRVEIIPGTEPRRVRLMSINPAYPAYEVPLDEVVINGRVIGRWVWK